LLFFIENGLIYLTFNATFVIYILIG